MFAAPSVLRFSILGFWPLAFARGLARNSHVYIFERALSLLHSTTAQPLPRLCFFSALVFFLLQPTSAG